MNQIISKLSKPSQVASTLDWKKIHGSTVLSLNFHRNRIGIAVASHPSTGQPVTELEPLNFANYHQQRLAIDNDCLDRFSKIIDDYNVCAVVVSWPLQHDTGRMGAACGRVIYALEQLWQRANEQDNDDESTTTTTNSNSGRQQHRNNVLSRPFCLWDSDHVVPKQRQDPAKRVDAFGRCASYGTQQIEDEEDENNNDESSSSKQTKQRQRMQQDYFASKERYHEDEMTVVVGVWNDFCKEHWPELYATSFAEPNEIQGRNSFNNKIDLGEETNQVVDTSKRKKSPSLVSSSKAYGT